MMNIRLMLEEDLESLREIHRRYYEEDFRFPDFGKHFISRFVVTTEDGKIISGGGLRTILEDVILTDKSFTPKQRKEALLKILHFSLFCMGRMQYENIHAFVQDDPNWISVMKRYGFRDIKGSGLVAG